MNLQENIQRIKQMMIKEDEVPLIKKMIDDIGLKNTFKMLGDYDKLDSYLTDSDKIDFIENTIHRLSRELESDFIGLALQEIDEEPIHYSDEDEQLHQIEYLGNKYVEVVYYDYEMDNFLGEYNVRYDSLPTQILDEIFRMLLDK
jgi:predicted RNA-binding protein with EMAP domain